MRIGDLEQLYDSHYWANHRLLAAVSELTPEQFVQSVAGSYGSVRNTLVHILSAEWGWLDRCGGPKRGERLKPEDYLTLASVTKAWSQVERHMRDFLAGLEDADLARDIEFTLPGAPARSIPLGDLMQHAAIHAVHHRGQVSLLLRMLGRTPGNFDLLLYAAEPRGASPAHHAS